MHKIFTTENTERGWIRGRVLCANRRASGVSRMVFDGVDVAEIYAQQFVPITAQSIVAMPLIRYAHTGSKNLC